MSPSHSPCCVLEFTLLRMHEMGYEKVGVWGISKGAELALTAGSLLPGLINAVIAVAPMSTVCQGFVKDGGIKILPHSTWSFRGKELAYSPLHARGQTREKYSIVRFAFSLSSLKGRKASSPASCKPACRSWKKKSWSLS